MWTSFYIWTKKKHYCAFKSLLLQWLVYMYVHHFMGIDTHTFLPSVGNKITIFTFIVFVFIACGRWLLKKRTNYEVYTILDFKRLLSLWVTYSIYKLHYTASDTWCFHLINVKNRLRETHVLEYKWMHTVLSTSNTHAYYIWIVLGGHITVYFTDITTTLFCLYLRKEQGSTKRKPKRKKNQQQRQWNNNYLQFFTISISVGSVLYTPSSLCSSYIFVCPM